MPGLTYEMYPGAFHLGLVANNDDPFVASVTAALPPFGLIVEDTTLCPAVPEPPAPPIPEPEEEEIDVNWRD